MKNEYEAKQAARKARLAERAKRAAETAAETYARAKEMASAIPFGQPVLVGHHSEGRDRRYRARIGATYDRAFRLQDEATDLARRADSVGAGGISSDDPGALEKLRAELAAVRRRQERMKAANAAVRAHKPDELRGMLAALGFTDAEVENILSPDWSGRPGFPAFALTNNAANARRIEARIKALEARRARAPVEIDTPRYTYREDPDDNRVLFLFPDRPDDETRTLLKQHAFRWSPTRGAWVRQLSPAGRMAAGIIREALDQGE